MPHAHPGEKPHVRIVTVTVSDTRTAADDTSGNALREGLTAAGFTVVRHEIVPDEPERLRALITKAIDGHEADAVISTGGTGLAPRDQTFEAVSGLVEKVIDGFGETFRRLSWDEIGARAILSRAIAGTYHRGVVIALPGSTNAVRLGVEKIIAPMLSHLVVVARG